MHHASGSLCPLISRSAFKLSLALCLISSFSKASAQSSGHGIPPRAIPVETRRAVPISCLEGVRNPGIIRARREDNFNIIDVPKFVLKLPFTIVMFVGWNLWSESAKKAKVKEGILAGAKNQPALTSKLTAAEIDAVADSIASNYAKNSPGAPNKLEVEKDASYYFVEKIFDKQLRSLNLPCNNSDYTQLVNVSLGEFKNCIETSDKSEEVAACVAEVESNGGYKLGHLSLQIMLREMLSSQNLSLEETTTLVDSAITRYDQCARDRILGPNRGDSATQLKLCVSSSILGSVRSLASSKIRDALMNQGMSADEANRQVTDIISGLNDSNCSLHSFFKGQGHYSSEQISSLERYSQNGNDGTARLTQDAYSCVNHVAKESGRRVVPRTLAREPLIQQHIADTAHQLIVGGHSSSLSEAQEQAAAAFNENVIRNIYNPCVERLQANNPSSLGVVDPTQCEGEIRAKVGGRVIAGQLDSKIEGMLIGIDAAKAGPLKTETLRIFNECQQRMGTSEARVVECLNQSLTHMLPEYASLKASKELGQDLSTAFPQVDLELRAIARQCVRDNFSDTQSFNDASATVAKLQEDCTLRITAYVTPYVAKSKIENIYSSQGIDSAAFIAGDFAHEISTFKSALQDGSPTDTALLNLNRNLSWKAYQDIAKTKAEEYLPGDANREDRESLIREYAGHSTQVDITTAPTTEALVKRLESHQDRLTLAMASSLLDKELSEQIKDPIVRQQIKARHTSELRRCLEVKDPKINCVSNLEANVTLEVLGIKVGSQLPHGVTAQSVLGGLQETFKDCRQQIPQDAPNRKALLDACQTRLIVSSVEAAALANVSSAVSNYAKKDKPALNLLLREQTSRDYRRCVQGLNIPTNDSQYLEALQECAKTSSVRAGVTLTRRTASNYSRGDTPPVTPHATTLDKFVKQALDACVGYHHTHCDTSLSALETRLGSDIASSAHTEATNMVLNSDLGNKMIYTGFGNALSTELSTKLLPHKSPDDTHNTMNYVINFQLANPRFIERTLNNPEGQALINRVKLNMINNPSYNPATDPSVQADFKKLLMKDTGPGTFTDFAFEAVAGPSYQKRITAAVDSWEVYFIESTSVSFTGALQTPSGRAARSLFNTRILTPQMNGIPVSKATIDTTTEEIKILLKKAAREDRTP